MDYHVNKPYPEITDIKPNEDYGLMMLDNIGGMNSEMSAVCKYMYNHAISNQDFQSLKAVFIGIAMVEMQHLDIFMTLALKLKMDPRLWTCNDDQRAYWSPAYLNYPNRLDIVLAEVIDSEHQAIEKYQQQIKIIKDPCIVAILERIIEDEQLHITILKEWETKLVR